MLNSHYADQSMIKFCTEVINGLKSKAISTHNHYLYCKTDSYSSGVAFAYYRAYILLQQQASLFLIPLKVVGLNKPTEKDLLSNIIIEPAVERVGKKIPDKYKHDMLSCLQDQVYVFKDEWLGSRQLLQEKIASSKSISEAICKYYEGEMHGYVDILNYMYQKARQYSISLASLDLEGVSLKTPSCCLYVNGQVVSKKNVDDRK